MKLKVVLLLVGALFLFAKAATADQSLKTSLGLSMDQAKQVEAVQAKFRKPFNAKRQELNKEMRALRRARLANDSAKVAELEAITEKLRNELRKIRLEENDQIRALLTPEQIATFEEVLQKRKEVWGSSRDERELDDSAD